MKCKMERIIGAQWSIHANKIKFYEAAAMRIAEWNSWNGAIMIA